MTDDRIEALAKPMFDAWELLTCRTMLATEQAVRSWEDADQWDCEGFREAARAALTWFGFDKCPREGAARQAIAVLRPVWLDSRDGTNIEVTWEDWQEAVRQALAALEGDESR